MTESKLSLSIILLIILGVGQSILAQPELPSPTPKTTNISAPPSGEVSREKREQAYTKLLEAQRHLWGLSRVRSQSAQSTVSKLAKQALLKAVELDPTLAEAYTALSELTLSTPPNDIEEAILLATIAAKLNPDNFGAHRILARIYTIKSRLNTTSLEPIATEKAVTEWKEVTRLDPRSAEAWAFLSEFYDRTNKPEAKIDTLKKWLAAATPLETRFYRTMLGTQEDLSPESAGLKLGAALIKSGRPGEAVEILSRSVADAPDNLVAIDLLRQAIESGEGVSSQTTLEMLQQSVFANPSNLVLVELLAEVQSRLGKTDEAVKTLRNTITGMGESDKNSVANLQVTMGDIFLQTNRNDEAISAYEQALKSFGIEKSLLTTDEDREFATKVLEKIIKTYKNAGKPNEIKATIERARALLGKSDLFADKQLISFFREIGKKDEALQTVRTTRKMFPDDYVLIRTEASILTELGKVDEGVSLIKLLISDKSAPPSPYYDDFSNYIFISGLYTQANRTKEAIVSAKQAFGVANTEERKQLASLSLATAQHQSGDYKLAEETLRNILKKTPENPIALNNLGYYLLEQNEKIAEAIELIQKAVKIDATNSSYLDSLGWGFYKLGKLDQAEKYLKNAIRINTTSPIIYEHLGDVYLKQGKIELAKSAWQKAINFSSDSAGVSRIKAKLANKVIN